MAILENLRQTLKSGEFHQQVSGNTESVTPYVPSRGEEDNTTGNDADNGTDDSAQDTTDEGTITDETSEDSSIEQELDGLDKEILDKLKTYPVSVQDAFSKIKKYAESGNVPEDILQNFYKGTFRSGTRAIAKEVKQKEEQLKALQQEVDRVKQLGDIDQVQQEIAGYRKYGKPEDIEKMNNIVNALQDPGLFIQKLAEVSPDLAKQIADVGAKHFKISNNTQVSPEDVLKRNEKLLIKRGIISEDDDEYDKIEAVETYLRDVERVTGKKYLADESQQSSFQGNTQPDNSLLKQIEAQNKEIQELKALLQTQNSQQSTADTEEGQNSQDTQTEEKTETQKLVEKLGDYAGLEAERLGIPEGSEGTIRKMLQENREFINAIATGSEVKAISQINLVLDKYKKSIKTGNNNTMPSSQGVPSGANVPKGIIGKLQERLKAQQT